MMLRIEEVTRLYKIYGRLIRRGEAVSQLQHALQCAHLAEQARGSCELVAAALLHDFGRLLVACAEGQSEELSDGHEDAAIPFLRGLFPSNVLEPIRLQLDAKRYLCTMDSAYWAALPASSRHALAQQGGPLPASEAALFLKRPFALDAIAIRKWSDRAKNQNAQPPDWAHFLPTLHRARGRIPELID